MFKGLTVASFVALFLVGTVNLAKADVVNVDSATTLRDAMISATEGTEIKLNNDIEVNFNTVGFNSFGYPSSNNVVIDGQGHSINITGIHGSDPAFGTISGQTFTIKNVGKVENGTPIGGVVMAEGVMSGQPGAVFYNNQPNGSINIVNSVFSGNHSDMFGGVMMYTNKGHSDIVDGYFYNNKGDQAGGVLSLQATYGMPGNPNIGKISGTFKNNQSLGSNGYGGWGGAIANIAGSIDTISAEFIENQSKKQGGAIYNSDNINQIVGSSFVENVSNTSYGGAVYNNGTIGKIENTKFIGNKGTYGGAIMNFDTIGSIENSEFRQNKATYNGGAIYNDGDIIEIKNTSFYDNVASYGGAIYTRKDLKFVSDDFQSVFQGNTNINDGWGEALCVTNENAVIDFELKNGGSVKLYDTIDGYTGYDVNIYGTGEGALDKTMFYLYNDIIDADVTFANTTINTINGEVRVYDTYNSFNLAGDTNFVADVDLVNKEMDRFIVEGNYNNASYNLNDHNLNVIGMNLMNDIPDDRTEITAVYFAEPGLKNNIGGLGVGQTSELPNKFQIVTPIYKYNVTYDNVNQYDGKGDGGYYLFTKGNKEVEVNPVDPTPGSGGVTVTDTGNDSDAFNPAVLAGPVAAASGAYTGMTNTYQKAFNHMDLRMFFASGARAAQRDANKLALADSNTQAVYTENERNLNGTWFRPYASYDSISLKNGPKIKSFNYGTFLGGDTEMKTYKNGWEGVTSAYISYMGSHDSYGNSSSVYQNGGTVGLTKTYYKNNFFTGVTLSAGASVAEASTMYGHESFPMLLAGIASKTGYNFEFNEGKNIIQPTMLLSYSFIHNFDYTNAAGVKISSTPTHAIQISPTVKFIHTTRNDWQPYLTVGMRWNLMDLSHFRANDVTLPQMSEKPYVEYGLGVHRHFKEKLCMIGQVTLRNGGRNGIAAILSCKYIIGKDDCHHFNHNKHHTVLKELSSPSMKIVKQVNKPVKAMGSAVANPI